MKKEFLLLSVLISSAILVYLIYPISNLKQLDKQNVSEEAFMNNRQQEPMLSGDPNKILIKFN